MVRTSCDQRLLGTYVSTINITIMTVKMSTQTLHKHSTIQHSIWHFCMLTDIWKYTCWQSKREVVFILYFMSNEEPLVRHKKFGFFAYCTLCCQNVCSREKYSAQFIRLMSWHASVILHMKHQFVFCDVKMCNLVDMYQHFGKTCCLHQGQRSYHSNVWHQCYTRVMCNWWVM